MADIDIQRKRGGPWGWIIGLVVLALVIWGIWAWADRDDSVALDDVTIEETEPAATPSAPAEWGGAAALDQFRETCTRGGAADEGAAEPTGDFTERCAMMLSSAIGSVSQQLGVSEEVRGEVEDLRDQIEELRTRDVAEDDDASALRDALDDATAAIESIHGERFDDDERFDRIVEQLRETTSELGDAEDAAAREQAARDYFEHAGTALGVLQQRAGSNAPGTTGADDDDATTGTTGYR